VSVKTTRPKAVFDHFNPSVHHVPESRNTGGYSTSATGNHHLRSCKLRFPIHEIQQYLILFHSRVKNLRTMLSILTWTNTLFESLTSVQRVVARIRLANNLLDERRGNPLYPYYCRLRICQPTLHWTSTSSEYLNKQNYVGERGRLKSNYSVHRGYSVFRRESFAIGSKNASGCGRNNQEAVTWRSLQKSLPPLHNLGIRHCGIYHLAKQGHMPAHIRCWEQININIPL
jgi:hypothetical protein